MKHPIKAQMIVRLLMFSLACVSATANAQAPHRSMTPEQLEFFEKNIRPVLAEHCYECHSEEKGKNKGELTLDTRDGIRAGGDRGPAVVPGKPDESVLINAIRQVGQLHMPPDSRGARCRMKSSPILKNGSKTARPIPATPRKS